MSVLVDRVRRDPGRALLVLALVLAGLLYLPTLGRGLVNYDDPALYRDNWIVQAPTWSAVKTIWFDLAGPHRFTLQPEYLPVRDMSVMLDFAIWGDRWGGFHATNVVLYLAAIALWFRAFVDFGVARATAGLAVLLWALHPAHAESVAWLSERKGLLGAMWAGACAVGYARFRAGGAPRWLVFAAVCAALAVWSKAQAAFAIAGLAGLEVALSARRVTWRRSLNGLGVVAVVGGLAFVPVLVLAANAHVVGTDVVAPAGRGEMVLGVLGLYARLAAMLTRNAIVYPLSTHGPTLLDLALGGTALMGLGIALWRGTPEIRAGALVWLFAWLPVSHLVLPLQIIFVADRYLLLPTLGLALLGAALLVRLHGRLRAMLCAVLVLAAAVRTLDAQANWRDDLTLWDRAVASNPEDGGARSYYVNALEEAGDEGGAWTALEAGLALARTPQLVMRAANMQLARGHREAGEALMREAAQANDPKAMSNLALLLLEDGYGPEALDWARRADGVPTVHAHRVHGKIALSAGLADEAIAAFTAAYELEPTDPTNQYNLALALITARRPTEALPYLAKCADAPATAAGCRAELARFHKQ